jgi:hypothetical protein
MSDKPPIKGPPPGTINIVKIRLTADTTYELLKPDDTGKIHKEGKAGAEVDVPVWCANELIRQGKAEEVK